MTQEGFNEADLTIAPNGDIVCVMRGGGSCGDFVIKTWPTPMYVSRSSDGGRTWKVPQQIADRRSLIAGSIAHAGAEECSLLEASWPGTVDLSRLPPQGKLKNVDFAIVDGETSDCSPTEDHTVREFQDPRHHTDPARGEKLIEEAVVEVVADVRAKLLLIEP